MNVLTAFRCCQCCVIPAEMSCNTQTMSWTHEDNRWVLWNNIEHFRVVHKRFHISIPVLYKWSWVFFVAGAGNSLSNELEVPLLYKQIADRVNCLVNNVSKSNMNDNTILWRKVFRRHGRCSFTYNIKEDVIIVKSFLCLLTCLVVLVHKWSTWKSIQIITFPFL